MSQSTQWDALEYGSLDLPYNLIERELSDMPRLVAGSNSYVTMGGKLVKRPGTTAISNTTSGNRVDRAWVVETLETPAKIYIITSQWQPGTSNWGLYYNRLDGTPGWTSVSAGNLRQIMSSTAPHEGAVSRGIFYAKGFPTQASGETLGTVQFDGSGASPTTTIWGLLGPQTPARISGAINTLSADITSSTTSVAVNSVSGYPAAPFNLQIDYELVTVTAVVGTTLTVLRGAQGTTAAAHVKGSIALYRDWTTSAHNVSVGVGWTYTYAYVTKTGHISNRAALETNPDNMPSETGAFINLIPKITVQGIADTTNIPSINIYRSSDGGGTYFLLDTITNTGAGSITYQDNKLASGSGNQDPVPDSKLDSANHAPDLFLNSPPPTVLAPGVTGTTIPVSRCTPIAAYAGRLWYAIGNTLFYSGNEEIYDGVPEEAWPAGTSGNFMKFAYPVLNLQSTIDGLYVTTAKSVSLITGTTKETFNPSPILPNVGAAAGHPRAIDRYGNAMVWLTNDYRIGVLQTLNFRTIQDPLFTDLVKEINAGAEVDIKYWADLEKEWLVVLAEYPSTPANNKVFVYDIKKSVAIRTDFWNTPWTLQASCLLSEVIRESQGQRRLCFATWNGSNSSELVMLDSTGVTATDDLPGAAGSVYDFSITTGLLMVPSGDHINQLRKPVVNPMLYDLRLERTVFAGDTDPDFYYFVDDTWTTPLTPAPQETVSRIDLPKGYKTMIYPIVDTIQRVAIRVDQLQSTDRFELQNIIYNFAPDLGD